MKCKEKDLSSRFEQDRDLDRQGIETESVRLAKHLRLFVKYCWMSLDFATPATFELL